MIPTDLISTLTRPAWPVSVALLALALQACGSSNANPTNNPTQSAGPTDYCSLTTEAMDDACFTDAMDDYFVALANCINVSDDADRAECESDADDERAENEALCGDQESARADLCAVVGESRYDPEYEPTDFVDPADIGSTVAANQYFPLVAGNTWVYEAGDETITVTVTDESIEIDGVTCVVVTDLVEEDGESIEFTDDWYAQDMDGNVWYFGELARNFEDGRLVDLDGSFFAGEDGAKPGILMFAMPQVGAVYRQEFALGEAEDIGEVIATDASESTDVAECDGTCLQTRDYTPLEPDANEFKFYAPNVGLIVEYDVEDPESRVELVEFTPGG